MSGVTVVLLRPAVGEAEAGHHLVEDQQETVLLGELAQAFKESRAGWNEALERLDDDACKLAPVLAHEACHRLQIVERRDQHLVVHAPGNAGGVGDRRGKFPARFGARLIRP